MKINSSFEYHENRRSNILFCLRLLLLVFISFTSMQAESKIPLIPKNNQAVYLGYRGAIDTSIDLNGFFNQDHTVMAWWMPQFIHTLEQPLVSSTGRGIYSFGIGNFDKGNSDQQPVLSRRPYLTVKIGNQQRLYDATDLKTNKWVHLALVSSNGIFNLYKNGVLQIPAALDENGRAILDGQGKTLPTSPINSSDITDIKPTGMIRIGRRATGSAGENWILQSYGLVDDVAVFGKALQSAEIKKIIASKRLNGYESGLLAGISFDDAAEGQTLPEKLKSNWQNIGHVRKGLAVTKNRNSLKDSPLLENPFVISTTDYSWNQLPFLKNQIWKVTQGMDNKSSSHKGSDAFCYDFSRADAETLGSPTFVTNDGRLHDYTDESGTSETLHLEIGNEQLITYMHIDQIVNHPAGVLDSGGKYYVIPELQRPTLSRGSFITNVGTHPNGSHLHMGAGDKFKLGPGIPMAFEDFWMSKSSKIPKISTDWIHIIRGYPKQGRFVKRMTGTDP